MSDSPFGKWNVADFWRPWLQLAPSSLVQPISVSINSNNSTAPQTEMAVLSKHSYGRQLGRISDALHALIFEKRKQLPTEGPLFEFMEMWEEIERVKRDSAESRVEQFVSDLRGLKDKLPEEDFARLRDGLVQALKATA